MERFVVFSSPYHFDYPVRILLRVFSKDSRFGLEIHTLDQMVKSNIDITLQELESLNKQLQDEIRCITNYESLTERDLFRLAEIGNYAFKRVFCNGKIQKVIQNILSSESHLSIQVASDDFFLPWELLYSNSIEGKIAVENFWGMRHIISRITSPSSSILPTVITVSDIPKIGLLTYQSLRSVKEIEIPFFEKLEKEGKIKLFKLRLLDPAPQKRRDEYFAFRNFMKNNFDLAHFACHAFYDRNSPNQSYLKLSEEFLITLQDMEVYGISISGLPLVMLNACETGNLSPLFTSQFVMSFLKWGARGVIATETSVPDSFAAEFAKNLYSNILTGETLGESLLKSRLYFWIQYKNPSGLLYSLYAPPSIKFQGMRRE